MRKHTRYLFGAMVLGASLLAASESFAYGAFAMGRNNNGGWWYGVSWNYNSRVAARNEAIRRCYRRGPRCRVETQFNGLCFAVAFQDRGNGYGWATREGKREAERVAMNGCEKYGRDCSIRHSVCDGN